MSEKLTDVRPATLKRVVEYLEYALGLEVIGPCRTITPSRILNDYGCMNYSINEVLALRKARMNNARELDPEEDE